MDLLKHKRLFLAESPQESNAGLVVPIDYCDTVWLDRNLTSFIQGGRAKKPVPYSTKVSLSL